MMYECQLENAEGEVIVGWYQADSTEAFRIADAMAEMHSEPLAMLCICHTADDCQHPAAWKVYPRGWVQDTASETGLDARRARFLTKVNDIFEHYGRQDSHAQ